MIQRWHNIENTAQRYHELCQSVLCKEYQPLPATGQGLAA
jgi:hypothetical protein